MHEIASSLADYTAQYSSTSPIPGVVGGLVGYVLTVVALWPVFRKGRLLYEVGVAPFTRLQVDTACGTLAQRALDCTVIELDTF